VLFSTGSLLKAFVENYATNMAVKRLDEQAHMLLEMVNEHNWTDDTLINQMQRYLRQAEAGWVLFDDNGVPIYTSNLSSDDQEQVLSILQSKGSLSQPLQGEEHGLFYFFIPLEVDGSERNLAMAFAEDSYQHLNQQIWFLLIISYAISFIIILMIGTKMITQYTKPIEAATRVANELAKGNYRARTYEERMDETGMLSRSINILARNLQEMTSQQEIQQDRLRTVIESMGSGLILLDGKGYIHLVNKVFIDQFQIDVSEYMHKLYYHAFQDREVIKVVEQIFLTETQVRKQLNMPVEKDKKHFEVFGSPIIGTNEEWKGIVLVFHDITETKRLEQMRKDFVANVSHELKTPITSIKGFSETLLDGAMADEELRVSFLEIILKESERLQGLINDLLDLTRIEQEGFKLDMMDVNLNHLLDDIVFMLSRKSEEKGVSLQFVQCEYPSIIKGDANRLKQVFINLINNGIMYTPLGGKVDVSISAEESKVTVNIKDTGVGIEKEEIPRIFERFYRVDKARSRNSGGTGLGLAIVKHLVEAHHGDIEVKSEKDEGTIFIVTFYK
jgi:two-component system phosphate regulon sensor histidine kinase PhoR